APDSEAHAEALNMLGLLQAAREQYDQAAPLLEEALDITAGLELGAQQIGVLADLGLVLENDVQYHRAPRTAPLSILRHPGGRIRLFH
ncbi:MAG: hypothetical protein OEM02_12990, partial [Desulfobulbaceae bacterium]|nr:hypothetical protein [Desulfobulbaceae bacterium]